MSEPSFMSKSQVEKRRRWKEYYAAMHKRPRVIRPMMTATQVAGVWTATRSETHGRWGAAEQAMGWASDREVLQGGGRGADLHALAARTVGDNRSRFRGPHACRCGRARPCLVRGYGGALRQGRGHRISEAKAPTRSAGRRQEVACPRRVPAAEPAMDSRREKARKQNQAQFSMNWDSV